MHTSVSPSCHIGASPQAGASLPRSLSKRPWHIIPTLLMEGAGTPRKKNVSKARLLSALADVRYEPGTLES